MFFLVSALCADAFTACFVYGADHVRIPMASAAILTALSTGILGFFLLAGQMAAPFLSGELPILIGSGLLFFLGLSKVFARPTRETARKANQNEPEILSPKEAVPLGLAISIDSAAAGTGAGLSGVSLPLLLLMTAVFTLLAIRGGCRLGRMASSLIRVDFSKFSGFVLMALALLKFTHPA